MRAYCSNSRGKAPLIGDRLEGKIGSSSGQTKGSSDKAETRASVAFTSQKFYASVLKSKDLWTVEFFFTLVCALVSPLLICDLQLMPMKSHVNICGAVHGQFQILQDYFINGVTKSASFG